MWVCTLVTAAGGAAAQSDTAPPDTTPPNPVAAEASRTFLEAFEAGTFHLGLRYRFEHVDDDAFADTAEASTLRTTLSYRTAAWRGWSLFLEAEDVSPVFDDDGYANAGRDGRGNGVVGVPVIADPEGTAMGQAYVRWQAGPGEDAPRVTLGRQEVAVGDQRYVGPVGWRQHHQSFDGARLEWAPGRWSTDYTYAAAVNRIFGDRLDLDGHFLLVGYELAPGHRLAGYGFHLDYDDPSPLSTRTLGLEAAGRWPWRDGLAVRYEVEAAQQEDAGDNPARVDTDYRLASLGLDVQKLAFDVTWEVLGGPGDGDRPFTTPLATLHKWNGWADKFLQTPVAGLETLYLRARGPLGRGLSWTVVYLDFAADEASLDLGSEVDAELAYKASWGQTFAVKLADYQAGERLSDARKIMFWSSYTF